MTAPTGNPKGRPSAYTDEIAERICSLIATSQKGIRGTLEANDDLPPLSTVQAWLRNNTHFQSLYARAKQQQLHTLAEDIIDISMDDSLDPADKRVQIDTRKWLLAKLMPRTYGDKLDITSGGEALAAPAHQIDARVQSIIMQAHARKAIGQELLEAVPEEARGLLE